MYVPEAFAVPDRAALLGAIAAHPLATLATNGPDGPQATPLPLVAEEGGTALLGHFARANPHWRGIDGATALAVFSGPDAYVTPDWYATKRETGKVVPTWNYVTVQARGRVSLLRDPDEARAAVERLTDAMEASRPAPWAVDDAPARYVDAMLRGIVAFRMDIASLTGAAKLSQNKSDADRAGVRAGLRADRPDDPLRAAMDSLTP